MDEVGGRTLMEDDNIVSFPLLSFPNLLLVPGQTLPLHLFQPQVTVHGLHSDKADPHSMIVT